MLSLTHNLVKMTINVCNNYFCTRKTYAYLASRTKMLKYILYFKYNLLN